MKNRCSICKKNTITFRTKVGKRYINKCVNCEINKFKKITNILKEKKNEILI